VAAQFCENPEIMRALLKAGGDVLAVDRNGENSFHVAVKMGRIAVAKQMLEVSGALNIANVRTQHGEPPLHLAALQVSSLPILNYPHIANFVFHA